MRFNYINSMLARMNRAVGDAAEMTKVLDEPRLVEYALGAPRLAVTEGAVDFEGIPKDDGPLAAGEGTRRLTMEHHAIVLLHHIAARHRSIRVVVNEDGMP